MQVSRHMRQIQPSDLGSRPSDKLGSGRRSLWSGEGGGLIFKLDFFSIVLLFSLVSDRSAAATAVVMDGWTGDVMWNVPWSQVKVEREPNPRPVSVWGRWVYQAERNVYFYGLNVSVEFVMEVNSVV